MLMLRLFTMVALFALLAGCSLQPRMSVNYHHQGGLSGSGSSSGNANIFLSHPF
jgi:hypothetical protein